MTDYHVQWLVYMQRLKKKGGVKKAIAPGGDEEGEGDKEEEGSALPGEEAVKEGEGIEGK